MRRPVIQRTNRATIVRLQESCIAVRREIDFLASVRIEIELRHMRVFTLPVGQVVRDRFRLNQGAPRRRA